MEEIFGGLVLNYPILLKKEKLTNTISFQTYALNSHSVAKSVWKFQWNKDVSVFALLQNGRFFFYIEMTSGFFVMVMHIDRFL